MPNSMSLLKMTIVLIAPVMPLHTHRPFLPASVVVGCSFLSLMRTDRLGLGLHTVGKGKEVASVQSYRCSHRGERAPGLDKVTKYIVGNHDPST